MNGAGRHGRQGFFRQLRRMNFDVSHLSINAALTKGFFDWKLGPGKKAFRDTSFSGAVSSVGVPLSTIPRREDIITDLRDFGRAKELDFLLIVTGYFDDAKHYLAGCISSAPYWQSGILREILVVSEHSELARHVATCFSEHDAELKLSSIRIQGLPREILACKQHQLTASTKTIRKILSDYFAQ